jgi:glycosyltransferase involved in cell wall biosynthesis
MAQTHDPPVQRVWLDVTMLADCATQPTGISRVVLAVLREWRQGTIADLRLCRFDDSAGGFVEVGSDVLVRFEARVAADQDIPRTQTKGNLRQLRNGIRKVLKPLVSWMPTAVKRLLKRKVKGYAHLVKDIFSVPIAGLRRLLKRPAPIATIPLGPADLVVMLGEDWKFTDRGAVLYRLKRERGFRTAWMIYDLISVYFPQFFGPGFEQRFANWIVDTLWTADLVFAISENTRADIQRFCLRGGIPCPQVEVIRLGENLPESGDAQVPEALRLTAHKSFAICVGTVEVRKNQLLLYHVWRKLIEKLGATDTPRLIIVGMRGWMAGNTMHLAEADPVTKEHICFLPKCGDPELRWLYQHCLFTLYPSFYEGWGLPVAESLAFGKVCIASDRSSIPEIASDLVVMHDPTSVEGCLTCVMDALEPSRRVERERRIRQQYRRHEWSECASQMADILHRHFGLIVNHRAQTSQNEARLAG